MLRPLIHNKFKKLIFNNDDDFDEDDQDDKYELDEGQIEDVDELYPELQFVVEQQLYATWYVWPSIVKFDERPEKIEQLFTQYPSYKPHAPPLYVPVTATVFKN